MSRRAWLWVAGAAVVVVGAYALAGFWWVPRFAETTALEFFEREYGRKAALERLSFNPFTFECEARGFSLPDADGARMIGIGRLYVDFELSSLWRRAWRFGTIELEQPYLRLVQRPDRRLNLADLALRKRATATPARPAPLPSLAIGHLTIREGQVDVLDQSRNPQFETTLRPVSFGLEEFESRGEGGAFEFQAESDRAGRLAVQGTVEIEPFASRGTIGITGLTATTITEYVGAALPVAFQDGSIDLQAGYDFSLAGEPFTLALELPRATARGLVTLARGYREPWQLASLSLGGARVDFAAQRVRVAALELRGLAGPAWLDAAGFHLPGAVPRREPEAPMPAAAGEIQAPSAAEPAAPRWQLELPEIKLAEASLVLEDRRLAPPAPMPLTVAELRVQRFAWPAQGSLALSATVALGSGGELALQGELGMRPLQLALAVNANSVDLRAAQPWLDGDTDLKLRNGTLATHGRLEYAAEGRPRLRYAGEVSVARLHTQDGALGEDFVTWSALELRGFEAAQAPARLAIREIRARDPYLRLILGANGVTNVLQVLDPEAAARRAAEIAAERAARAAGRRDEDQSDEPEGAALPPPPPAQERMPARIGTIRVVNGNVNFTDYTLEPKFEIAVERLAGTITGMTSTPGERARLELAGEVDRYAPARIAGELNLLAAQSYLDITASFRNIELTSFNPYSGKFAGYRIDKGKLNIETSYKVENRRLAAEHRFTLDQLQLGERVESADAVSLPLKLAVALLKDRNGVIDIDLPVSGSLDDPRFRLGPIIWKAVLNLLGKIVTSPFALLGKMFGGGADLSQLPFAPGSAELDAAARERLASLRQALIERPGLQLDIPSTLDPAADRGALLERRWNEAVGDAAAASREAYRDRLLELHRERLGQRADIPKPPAPAPGESPADPVEHAITVLEPLLRATQSVAEEELAALAEGRAARVRDSLLADGAVNPARVFLIRGEPAATADGAVQMKLSLK